MTLLTLVFSGIGAAGVVYGAIVASQPLRRVFEGRHRRLEHERQSYAEMFSRLYRFVMDDLDGNGKCKAANAQVFTEIAGNVMYLHAGDELKAWQWYRDVHGL